MAPLNAGACCRNGELLFFWRKTGGIFLDRCSLGEILINPHVCRPPTSAAWGHHHQLFWNGRGRRRARHGFNYARFRQSEMGTRGVLPRREAGVSRGDIMRGNERICVYLTCLPSVSWSPNVARPVDSLSLDAERQSFRPECARPITLHQSRNGNRRAGACNTAHKRHCRTCTNTRRGNLV